MTHALTNLQPAVIWDYFYQLTQVPRPSKHEDKIQAFMIEFGESLGLETLKDETGNVIIKKPATTGYENRQGVVLQAHLDMVPQANNDTPHNFETDPIEAYVEGEWVTANGTTLGADNGIGVAAIMAVLAADNIEHGPIEALLTCDEETGMTGAFGLKNDVLNGDILLNLDSEDEKELYIGCAGGVDGKFILPLQREATPTTHTSYTVNLSGLKGGHSGMDIILQRGNANKLLARLLSHLGEAFDYRLSTLNGGNLSNAIPREANALVTFDAAQLAKAEAQIASFNTILTREFGELEPNATLSITPADQVDEVLSLESHHTLLNSIHACHNGVYRMSTDIEGLVETSNNLAIVNTEHDKATVECMLRSSVDSAREDLTAHIGSVFELAGAEVEFYGAYPGWQPNPNSAILNVMKQTGEALFGSTPKIHAIHAGLECGLLGGIYPNWDMISFGPTIRAPHSPDEKVNIASVAIFYDWLLATLKAIPVKN